MIKLITDGGDFKSLATLSWYGKIPKLQRPHLQFFFVLGVVNGGEKVLLKIKLCEVEFGLIAKIAFLSFGRYWYIC